MPREKLHKILQHLSDEEISDFKSRLMGQFKPGTKMVKLFKYLYKFYPDFDDEKALRRELVFRKVFGNETFNRSKLAEVGSRLIRQVERFLIDKEVEEIALLRDTLLCQTLKRRGADELFGLYYRKTSRAVSKKSILGREDYHALFKLTNQVSFHRSTEKFTSDYGQHLLDSSTQLDYYYLCNKLHIACEFVSSGVIITHDYPSNIVSILKKIIGEHTELPTVIRWYLDILYLFEKNDESLYWKLKSELLVENIPISKEEHYNFIGFLINYCNKAHRTNPNISLTTELAELYKFMVQEMLIIEDGYISSVNYHNLITILIAAKETGHAKEMLKLSKYLKPDEDKGNGALLAAALIDFAEKKYKATAQKLVQVKFKDLTYSLIARCLILKTYYELGEYTDVIREARNARRSIKTMDLSDGYIMANNNFFDFVSELSQSQKYNAPPAYVLSNTFNNYSPLVYREWCQQKLDEL